MRFRVDIDAVLVELHDTVRSWGVSEAEYVEILTEIEGPRAPPRRRPRRVAKKLRACGGYTKYGWGAHCARIQSQRNDPHEIVAVGAPVTASLESDE